jgi:hypothetical protein
VDDMIHHGPPVSALLLDGPALSRATIDRDYLMSLSAENRLRTLRLQSGLWGYSGSV